MKNIKDLVDVNKKYYTLYCSQMPVIPESTALHALQKCPDVIMPHAYMTYEHIQEEDNPIAPYLYIEACMETKKHLKALLPLQQQLRGYNITPVGYLKGDEIVALVTKSKASSNKKYPIGSFVKIKRGEFANVIVPVINCDDTHVWCEVEIFSFKRVFELAVEEVEDAESIQLPDYPFINYVEKAREVNQRKAMVIDGTGLFFRGMFRYSTMFSRGGTFFVGGAYGFYLSLLKNKTLYPEYEIYTVFDGRNRTKYENNPEYKLNRKRYNDAFRQRFDENIKWVQRMLTAIGFPIVIMDEEEGDDVIGSVANHLLETLDYSQVLIHSIDTDFYSLVKDNLHIVQPKKSSTGPGSTTLIQPADVLEEFGISDIKKVNWVRLAEGDKSDNIVSVNQYNLRQGHKLPNINGKVIRECVNNAETVDEFRELLLSQKSAQFFIESKQFDLNLKTLTIDLNLLNGQGEIYHKYGGGKFDEPQLIELLEEFSFFKEVDALSRNSKILKSEW